MLPAPVTKEAVMAQDREFVVVMIPTEQIHRIWAFIEGELMKEPSLWNFGHTTESIKSGLLAETLRLWLVGKGQEILFSFMTRGSLYPTDRTVLEVVWGRGERLESFLPLTISALEVFGQKFGYDAIEVMGRKGWEKPLGALGFTHHQTVLLKKLRPERMN